ncbi:MAG: hypothetical protein IIB05_06400 [Bacteroidetes bacterium]|nr:hypothetical protein [Bacteroidota bacterium]
MKNIDKIIRNNRELFDTAEPDEGHFNRFAARLKRQKRKNRSFTSYTFLLKAASVAILVALSFLWTYDNLIKPSPERSGISLSEISDEYREVEIYYKQQVNLRYGQIRDMDVFSDSRQKAILLKELSDMDSIYTNLRIELETSPKNERIINAMIEHYQLKVDVMNQILRQLEQIKNENPIKIENHESNQI